MCCCDICGLDIFEQYRAAVFVSSYKSDKFITLVLTRTCTGDIIITSSDLFITQKGEITMPENSKPTKQKPIISLFNYRKMLAIIYGLGLIPAVLFTVFDHFHMENDLVALFILIIIVAIFIMYIRIIIKYDVEKDDELSNIHMLKVHDFMMSTFIGLLAVFAIVCYLSDMKFTLNIDKTFFGNVWLIIWVSYNFLENLLFVLIEGKAEGE